MTRPGVRCFGLLVALAVAPLLAACAGGPQTLGLEPAALPADAALEPVLVATSRKPDADPLMMFNGERSAQLAFAELVVSVPREREPGSIAYPAERPDPARQFATAAAGRLDGDGAFRARLDQRLAERGGARTVFVFVHGYNVSFAHGVFRHAQIRHDYDVPGVAVSYSWPSAGKLPLYLYDRDSMRFAVDGLIGTLDLVARSDAGEIVMLAHSMGTQLATEAMREMALRGRTDLLERLEAVILAAPDIDVDVFNLLYRDIAPLPDPFIVLVSKNDRALQASERLRGGHPRLGEGADVDDLRRNGITVIDLTDVKDGGRGSHATFARSPTLIAMVQSGKLRLDHLTAGQQPSAGGAIGEGIGALSDLAAGIVYLPATVAGVR